MTNTVLKNIVLTVVAVALCCCSDEKKSEIKSAEPDFATTVITFDTIGHVNDNEANPQFKYSYKLALPDEGISACADSIRLALIAEATGFRSSDIETSRKSKIATVAVMTEEDIVAYREMFSANEMPFIFDCEAGKVFEDSDIYNSVFSAYSYMGGAHPYSYANFRIWDKAKAKILTLNDIFVDGCEYKLADMILDSLCKIMDVKGHDNLIDAGILDVKDVFPNNNIRINADTLSFNYKPYEIAAYAVGPIEVKFSFSDLKPLLKTESSIYKFAE